MAKHCEICGKGQMSGNYVSFSHKKTKRTWKPKCLKAGKVERVY